MPKCKQHCSVKAVPGPYKNKIFFNSLQSINQTESCNEQFDDQF